MLLGASIRRIASLPFYKVSTSECVCIIDATFSAGEVRPRRGPDPRLIVTDRFGEAKTIGTPALLLYVLLSSRFSFMCYT